MLGHSIVILIGEINEKLTFNDLNSPETMRNPIMFYKTLWSKKSVSFTLMTFMEWEGHGLYFTMMMWLLF